VHVTSATHNQDILFHVLYGGNDEHIRALIEESVIDISREYPTDDVRDSLHCIRPGTDDSLNRLRVKFFLLLGENEAMRRRISESRKSPGLLQPLCLHKARRFYDELCDDLIPEFLQNETIRLDQFVDKLRATYLHS
jgi:hypothetical protein